MLTLRLTHSSPEPGTERVELKLLGAGERLSTDVTFELERPRQDEEDLRWYLEDFLLQPQEPSPALAQRIERRIDAFGGWLFRRIFDAGDDARRLWAAVRPVLARTRLEIVTAGGQGDHLPWELLRDAASGESLALAAGAFARAPVRAPEVTPPDSGPLRILLIISRPLGAGDVAFRSVAQPLVRSLRNWRPQIDLVVLRPPNFEALGHRLRRAVGEGRPFQVVHFDGHGVWEDLDARFAGRPARRPRGHLVFEASGADTDADREVFVPGKPLGRLLRRNGVRLLVLNACRSSQSRPAPSDLGAGAAQADPRSDAGEAWGSLAREVVDAGVSGVVAMRFDTYASTAARFVADLYASLIEGRSLGEATTLGRRKLAADPWRSGAGVPLCLRDWMVPVVYEAEPLVLLAAGGTASTAADGDLPLSPLSRAASMPAMPNAFGHDAPSGQLPSGPEAGFCGRGDALLALDRAFDRHTVALLYADTGSGKTATAVEFARWYAETGGIEGPVLFTSFEPSRSLAQVLDQLAPLILGDDRAGSRRWLRWSPADRRAAALELCRRQPLFWIWDNVESIDRPWSAQGKAIDQEESEALTAFLAEAAETRARFLLTSILSAPSLFGDLAVRVNLLPLSPQERLQLTQGLLERRGEPSDLLVAWKPLLDFSAGHPLTLELVVGQALREGATSPEAAAELAERLRRGTLALGDGVVTEENGIDPGSALDERARELRALLSYGLNRGFTSEERRVLSLLVFFQDFVAVDILAWMADPQTPWRLPWIPRQRQALMALLDRAADAGLLRRLGEGEWNLHPVLPWFLRRLFDRHHGRDQARAAERAWVEAMGVRSNTLFEAVTRGEVARMRELRREEANFLEARRLALRRGLWHRVTSAMQGLYGLYDHTGRLATWAELVEEIVPEYIDPRTGGPVPGREQRWGQVVGYRVRLARQRGDLALAERWQGQRVEAEREAAAAALATPRHDLQREERHALRDLGTSLHELGQIQREMGRAECVATYMEAIELAADLGDRAGASACALNLGHAYEDLPEVRDLDQAETWYDRSLAVRPEGDFLGRALCLGSLGSVARERFREARDKGGAAEELKAHLHQAKELYRKDLEILPADAVSHRAVAHQQLGNTYSDLRDGPAALFHYREAIRCEETAGDRFGAASARFNAALHLRDAGRLSDALSYAESALAGFEASKKRGEELVAKARVLIEDIRGRQEIREETRGQVESLLGDLSLLDELSFE